MDEWRTCRLSAEWAMTNLSPMERLRLVLTSTVMSVTVEKKHSLPGAENKEEHAANIKKTRLARRVGLRQDESDISYLYLVV